MIEGKKEAELLLSLSGTHFFKSNLLLYRLDLGYMPGMPQRGISYKLSEQVWDTFWKEIETIGVFNWNDTQDWPVAFPEREGAAGCGVPSLSFVIGVGDKLATCRGVGNRFPPRWSEFWRSVEKLTVSESEQLDQVEMDNVKEKMAAVRKVHLSA